MIYNDLPSFLYLNNAFDRLSLIEKAHSLTYNQNCLRYVKDKHDLMYVVLLVKWSRDGHLLK